ncbi:MAG: hypothetical protein ACR2LK_02600 [Solirubrobacteraceae bacterium]
MPVDLLIAGAAALLSFLLFAMLMMRHGPTVIVSAPVPKHPCGFVPNV